MNRFAKTGKREPKAECMGGGIQRKITDHTKQDQQEEDVGGQRETRTLGKELHMRKTKEIVIR